MRALLALLLLAAAAPAAAPYPVVRPGVPFAFPPGGAVRVGSSGSGVGAGVDVEGAVVGAVVGPASPDPSSVGPPPHDATTSAASTTGVHLIPPACHSPGHPTLSGR